MRSRLLKRLPILVLVLIGAWVYNGGGNVFPKSRELIWQLPQDRATIREVEIQLWSGEELLKREWVAYSAQDSKLDIVQEVPLKDGEYLARVFIKREGAKESKQVQRAIQVGEEERVYTPLE